MNIFLGRRRYRIELCIRRHALWFRLPFIGQGMAHTQLGWSFDGWRTVRDEQPMYGEPEEA